MDEEDKPKLPLGCRRRYNVDPLEEFINFNIAQSTIRIVDNMGFNAAHPWAIELLSRLMKRYFEDLCKRVAYSKEYYGKHVATLEDIEFAYGDLQISLDEFEEFVTQVRPIAKVPMMPLIPFKGFADSRSGSKFPLKKPKLIKSDANPSQTSVQPMEVDQSYTNFNSFVGGFREELGKPVDVLSMFPRCTRSFEVKSKKIVFKMWNPEEMSPMPRPTVPKLRIKISLPKK